MLLATNDTCTAWLPGWAPCLSAEMRHLPTQRAVYTGLVVDTFLKTLLIPDDKKRKLAAFLELFFNGREASLTEPSSPRG